MKSFSYYNSFRYRSALLREAAHLVRESYRELRDVHTAAKLIRYADCSRFEARTGIVCEVCRHEMDELYTC